MRQTCKRACYGFDCKRNLTDARRRLGSVKTESILNADKKSRRSAARATRRVALAA